jgi:hypothetical protein
MASTTVEVVKEIPIAWISASRWNPNACRYGTAGTANTPVTAVTSPVTTPTKGPSQRACASLTCSCRPVRLQPA